MKDPCERCIEYDFCESTQLPCERKEAYARWKLKCKEIREHTIEIMARAKEQKNGRKERDFEPKNDNSNYEFKMDFLKTAISAMQELQMYKENQLCLIPESVYKRQCEELDEYKKLGTLEELKEITQINFNAVELSLIYNCIEQLIKYQQLGTLEEVRYAVEKQTAISREIIEGKYFCPKCHNLMPYPGYCGCGQKLY